MRPFNRTPLAMVLLIALVIPDLPAQLSEDAHQRLRQTALSIPGATTDGRTVKQMPTEFRLPTPEEESQFSQLREEFQEQLQEGEGLSPVLLQKIRGYETTDLLGMADELIANEDVGLQRIGIGLLAGTTAGEAADVFIRAYRSSDSEVRTAAIAAASNLPTESLYRLLSAGVQDPDPRIQQALLRAAQQLEERHRVLFFEKLANSGATEVHRNLVPLLLSEKSGRSLRILESLAASGDPAVRQSAALALKFRLPPEEKKAWINEVIQSSNRP